MPAGKWKMYESAKLYIADGTLDLDDDEALLLALSGV